MAGKVPLVAFCEEYDEDSHAVLPGTRQVASQKTRRSLENQNRLSLSTATGSDSGYSSVLSGAKSPLDSSSSSTDPTTDQNLSLISSRRPPPTTSTPSSSSASSPAASASPSPSRSSSSNTPTSSSAPPPPPAPPRTSSRKEKARAHRRDRSKDLRRLPREGVNTTVVNNTKMQAGPYSSGPYAAATSSSAHPRSSSTSGRPGDASGQVRHYPGTCPECDNGLYHSAGPSTGASTPLEPPAAIDLPYYASAMPDCHGAPPPPPPPPLPPTSQTSPYSLPPSYGPHDIVPHSSSRPSARSGRSNSYHANGRPMSFSGALPGGNGYGRYDYGPPLSASAYSHSPSFGPTPYGPQPPYYSLAEYGPPPEPQPQSRERSMSRSRDYPKGRRASMYGPPQVNCSDPPTPTYDDGDAYDRGFSRDSRPSMSPHSASFDYEEDYYRMPPPPLKQKPTIIQKRPEPRKMPTTNSVHEHRPSKSFDMGDLDGALPLPPSRAPRYRRSREHLIPERSRSLRSSRRNSYRDPSARPSRMAVEGARRRRATYYDYEDLDADEIDESIGEFEDKQREVEEYQAAKAKKTPVPLTEDALRKAKASHRVGSDSGSRSNSSRGSDARTPSGSNAGSNNNNNNNTATPSNALAKTEEENKNIVMTMNGVTMSFTQESIGGKKLSLRTGDTGGLELNIGGNKPKKYLTTGSEYAGTVARRELEGPRRPRDSRRSERPSAARSSRSTYSGRYLP